MIFKAKLTKSEGEWHITSFANRLIPYELLFELNNAVHDVVDRRNGKTAWKRYYIRFEHDGKTYHQIDRKGLHCEGCCFFDGGFKCRHPYYDTKGDCENKIYKEEK